MKKVLDGIFTMLRKINRDQKKQLQILKRIEKNLNKEIDIEKLIREINKDNCIERNLFIPTSIEKDSVKKFEEMRLK